MEINNAIKKFSALSQETRLKAFKILVEHGSKGIAAGELARKLDVPANTLSFHLTHLSNADLISSVKHSRQVIYKANLEQVEQLIMFLVDDCCAADSKTCNTIEKLLDKKICC